MARGDWPPQPPIGFITTTWRGKVGPAWPEIADTGQLTREDIFRLSDAQRQGSVTTEQLLAAVGIWGYGKGGRGGYRVQHWLAAENLINKLDTAIDLARSGNSGGAYRCLQPRALDHIDGLGPAFFTKLFYFAAYKRGENGVQPLILDKFVALGLRQRTQDAWPTTGWSSHQYLRYLDTARRLADAANGPGEPDLVEFELFKAGKKTRSSAG